MAKKADLEADYQRYASLNQKSREAKRKGDFRAALECAVAALPHVSGMIQFTTRFEGHDDPDSVEAIDTILSLSPTVFRHHDLDEVDTLLKQKRLVERRTNENISQRICDARKDMRLAHKLYTLFERESDVTLDEIGAACDPSEASWNRIVDLWTKMGILQAASSDNSRRLRLTTRMGGITPAKCPLCGVMTDAPKAMLLESFTCPSCERIACFVIMAPNVHQSQSGKS